MREAGALTPSWTNIRPGLAVSSQEHDMRRKSLISSMRSALAFLCLVGWAGLASAQSNPLPREPVITERVGTFNGQRVRYQAIVEETEVTDGEGVPAARIVSTAYVAQDVRDRGRRPVVFLWNGGPIVASVYLHMGAFGPRRVAFPDDLAADTTKLPIIDNPHTILDVADLVFVDPAETGFSRLKPGVPSDRFHSVEADAQQTAAFIAQWLKKHDRLESPQYLFGESYGTMRAAKAAQLLLEEPYGIAVEGVILFGQALNIVEFSQRPGNIISYAVSMPTLSALAWHHGRVDRSGRTLEQFLAESREFARSEYLQALYTGNRLSAQERTRIARRLQELTGISSDYYLEHDLRISKEQYRRELFRKEGLIVGRSDGRYVGPTSDQPGGGDPSDVLSTALEKAFQDYLRSELHVPWQDEYRLRAIPERGLEGWDWGATTPFSDWPYMSLLSGLFETKPDFRVLVGVGIYDTSTTTGASEYALAQSGWPRDRASIAYYGGGHMAYSDERSFRKLMRDIRAFVAPPSSGR